MNNLSIRIGFRILIWSWLFGIASVIAAPPHSSATKKITNTEPVPLTFFVYGQPGFVDAWRTLCDEYSAKHPRVKVTLRNVPGYRDFFSKLLTLLAARTPPDVVFMSSPQIPAYVERNALLDLSEFVNKKEYFPEAVRLFSYHNKLYAFPTDLAINVLFYNKDVFDNSGVSYPTDDWTWKDLLENARRLTVLDLEGHPVRYGYVRGNPYYWFWQNGGDLVDNPQCPSRSTFDDKKVIEAITFLNELERKYDVVPSFSAQKEMDSIQMFQSGKVAMLTGGHWWLPLLARHSGRVGIALLPKMRERSSYCSGSGLSVMAGSKHPREAIEFARYLASKDAQIKLCGTNLTFPARQDIAESPDFLNALPGIDKRAFLASVPYLKLLPCTPAFNQIDGIIWKGLELVWTGEASPAIAAEKIKKKIDAVLKYWQTEKNNSKQSCTNSKQGNKK